MLAGCDTMGIPNAATTPTLDSTPATASPATSSNPALIDQWARTLEAGKIDEAKTMTTIKSPYWEASTREMLVKAPWKSHRLLDLPSDEKPYAPPGTVRVQWTLQLAETDFFRLICTDVRENEGKIETFNKALPCNASGKLGSGLEPLLFAEGDLPGAKFNSFGGLDEARLQEHGMPQGPLTASIDAKRSATATAPDYFVNAFLSDPSNVDATFEWWQGSAPKPLTDISGVGERAFGMETQESTGIHRSILFVRCDVVVQVEAVTPMGESPLDFNVIKSAAEKIDQRVQPELCKRPEGAETPP